jgi:two-component system chemotaxis response regulator CheY
MHLVTIFDDLILDLSACERVMAHILVVDDSKIMREMLMACLRGIEGMSFDQAASGLEAIEQISLRHFDLVLLDLNMPDIGGIEVVEFIRGQDRLRGLPIIVVTTRGDEASRERALGAGANRFMTKPFTPEAILAEVQGLLGAPSQGT